jgi:hypothetical protein
LNLSTRSISQCRQRPAPAPVPPPVPPPAPTPAPEPEPQPEPNEGEGQGQGQGRGQSDGQTPQRTQTIPFETAGIITWTNQGGFAYFSSRRSTNESLQAAKTELFIPNAEQVKQIKTVLSNNGPLVIAVYADDNLTRYVGNNFPLPRGQANHAVTLVGYDVDNNGVERWIVQNSWSTNWGEKGIVYCPIRNSYITFIVGFVQPGTPIANLYP